MSVAGPILARRATPAAFPAAGALGWRSVAVPAGLEVDPLALVLGPSAERPGFLLASEHVVVAGIGAAARLALPHGLTDEAAVASVRPWLADIAPDEAAGGRGEVPPGPAPTGPVALGALPFRPDAPTGLVVPSLCYVRVGRDAHATVVGPRGATAALARAARAALHEAAEPQTGFARPPCRLHALHDASEGDFARAVGRALSAIGEGGLTKVVLARRTVATFDDAPDALDVLRRLRRREPRATLYAVVDDDAFVGASPELLVARTGAHVESWPLAGTARIGGDPATDAAAEAAMLASPKERDEHAQVVGAIVGALAPYCEASPAVTGPAVARLRSMAHLASSVSGTLRGDTDALTLVRALHPTPAVAGSPTDVALALLAALEPTGRDRYAGPVGWMDARGDGAFVVGIRGATIDGHRAVLHAGAGIVAGSDPACEAAETTLKLRATIDALLGDA